MKRSSETLENGKTSHAHIVKLTLWKQPLYQKLLMNYVECHPNPRLSQRPWWKDKVNVNSMSLSRNRLGKIIWDWSHGLKRAKILVPWNLVFSPTETGVISPKAAMFSIGKALEIPAFPSCIIAWLVLLTLSYCMTVSAGSVPFLSWKDYIRCCPL